MKTLAHAYPWDIVGDPAAPARLRDLGVDGIALAASYHTVRAATPQHPVHRVVDAQHAALYTPLRPSAWEGRRLAPAEPAWMSGGDTFGEAARALRNVGLPVHAWIVLTHSSRLGERAPDVCVRNAFGDRYPYALCPAQPEVIDYCQVLVREIVECARPDGVVLEACGALGFTHGGHHEKTEGAEWSGAQQQLLSLCFCTACMSRYADAGLDAVELRRRVRLGVDTAAGSIEEALGDMATSVALVRASLARHLRQRVVAAAQAIDAGIRITLHASADPWATGAFATIAGGVDAAVDVLVANGWAGAAASHAAIAAMRAVAGAQARLASYVLILSPRPAEAATLTAELAGFAQAGIDEFHFYHAGLASAARLHAMRQAIARAD